MGHDPRTYWANRVSRYVGVDDLQAVTATGAPRFVGHFTHWLERRALGRMATGIPKRAVFLDVGCGYGRWFDLWHGMAEPSRFVGLDLTMSLLQRGHELHPELPLVAGNVLALPVRPSSFDVVVCVKVLQYVPVSQKTRALRELALAVRPGGLVAILELIKGNQSAQVFPGSSKDWTRWANSAGLSLVRWEPTHFYPLDQALEALRSTAAAANREDRHTPSSPQGPLKDVPKLKNGQDTFRSTVIKLGKHAYVLAKLLDVSASWATEPMAERILPPSRATHGMFVFERR